MENKIDPDKFEAFIRALGKASDRILREGKKRSEMRIKMPVLKKGKNADKILSYKLRQRIKSAMKKLNLVFDERDKRYVYVQHQLYELSTKKKEDEKKIEPFLKNLEKEINSYIDFKKGREKRISELEKKISKKLGKPKKEVKKSPAGRKDKIMLLKKRLSSLKAMHRKMMKRKKSSSERKKLKDINNMIKLFQSRLELIEKRGG
ncbi:MAG: hypothetical protein NTV63_03165 [Candidatus Woesearchaeota archaeon]|nr:hypothetical protein [Candidatus Woesearchaeota archaeon]